MTSDSSAFSVYDSRFIPFLNVCLCVGILSAYSLALAFTKLLNAYWDLDLMSKSTFICSDQSPFVGLFHEVKKKVDIISVSSRDNK